MTRFPAAVVQPMSDRRFVIVLIGVITALVGIALVVLAGAGLQEPVYTDFDTGTRTDSTRLLVVLAAVGTVLAAAGAGTAVALIRTQLHPSR